MIGVFVALDTFLFYIFLEIVLVPMYLIIGIWGGANRIYASYKFFLYTLLGSVLMLIAMLWMANEAGTTYIPTLLNHDFPVWAQTWLWLAFFASFAVHLLLAILRMEPRLVDSAGEGAVNAEPQVGGE